MCDKLLMIVRHSALSTVCFYDLKPQIKDALIHIWTIISNLAKQENSQSCDKHDDINF